MKLIVGLGNPGEKYRLTRHNIGANVAKKLAKLNNISIRRHKYLSRFGEGKISGKEACILLPLTYMNLSGRAVNSIVKDKEAALSDVFIICDDAELEFGNMRIRPGGSDGGHRGLRSIIESLGSDSFPRLRIGIGKKENLKAHVLAPFRKDEMNGLKEIKDKAVCAVMCWLTDGITQAMNIYNAKKTG